MKTKASLIIGIMALLVSLCLLASCSGKTTTAGAPSQGPTDGDLSFDSQPSNSSSLGQSSGGDKVCIHEAVTDPAVEATCTVAGKSEGSHCGMCGQVLVAQQETPATGHDWQDATCKTPKTCRACSAVEGDPCDHQYEDQKCVWCGMGKPSQGLLYQKNDKGYVVIGIGTCRDENMVIPSMHEGLPVVGISATAFQSLNKIKTLYIPGSVKTIESGSFLECTALEEVVLEEGVTTILAAAFEDCSSLKKITIPGTVTTIKSAFEGTVIQTVCINNLASWCAISFDENDPAYANPLFFAEELFLDGQRVTDLVIPKEVTKISPYAFIQIFEGDVGLGIQSVVLPEGLKSIGEYAFLGCTQITELVLPNGIEKIGQGAFADCSKLESVVIPNTVTILEEGVFGDCYALTNVTIPEGVTQIAERAFSDCDKLESIVIPESVTYIGEEAFVSCSGLKSIVFKHTGWTELTIADNAFSYTGITELTIPEGTKSIGTAFSQNKLLKKVVFVEGATASIGAGAFEDCTALESISISSGVTEIVRLGFSGCTNLKEITVSKDNSIYKSEGNCLIATWSEKLIRGCDTSVIPAGVRTIEESAFEGCAKLSEVVVPEGVQTIGQNAFKGCTALSKLTLPESLRTIKKSAFDGCSSLKKVVLPEGLQKIEEAAFANCDNLMALKIPFNTEIVLLYGWVETHGKKTYFLTSPVTPYLTSTESSYFNNKTLLVLKEGSAAHTNLGNCYGFNWMSSQDYDRIWPEQPEEAYTSQWFDWLLTTGGQNEDFPGIKGGSLHDQCNYGPGYFPSAWEVSPWDANANVPLANARFCLLLRFEKKEFEKMIADKFSAALDADRYTWKTYYRVGSAGEYKVVEGSPYSAWEQDGYIIFRCPLADYGMEGLEMRQGVYGRPQNNRYQMFFMIYDNEGNLLGWSDQTVDWTDSSEAFFLAAINAGIISHEHVEVIDPKVDATCSREGKTQGSHCAVCRKVFVAQQKIEKVECNWVTEGNHVVCSMCGETREPYERYSTVWLEWLTYEDMGETEDYPLIYGSGLYTGCDYDGDGPMSESAWELWPFDSSEKAPEEGAKFHLCLRLSNDEFDGYTGVGTEDYKYTWKIYYRNAFSDGEYKCVTGNPWSCHSWDETSLYRLNLIDYGMEKPEVGAWYHMIFFIFDEEGEMVGWTDHYVDWTDSSEAYYRDAVEYGIIG